MCIEKWKRLSEAELLRVVATGNETEACDTFGCLCEISRPFLHSYLAQLGVYSVDRREDILQETFSRLWARRESFRNHGIHAWHAMLRKTARNCGIDLMRRDGREVPTDQMSEREEGHLDTYALDADPRQRLAHLAHIALLPLDRRLSPRTHTRQLLAAQLFYLEGADWNEIADALKAGPEDEPMLTRQVLDDWLESPGVVRYLAYQQLYLSGIALAALLLGCDGNCPAAEVCAKLNAALTDTREPAEVMPTEVMLNGSQWEGSRPQGVRPQNEWTRAETLALIWRLVDNVTPEEILRRRPNGCTNDYTKEELCALLDRIRACYPFQEWASRLVEILGREGTATLSTPELWQRLAFQYSYFDGLPHRDVVDRVAPAASQVSYTVTANAHNMWISGKRLIGKITALCHDVATGKAEDSHAWLRRFCEENS